MTTPSTERTDAMLSGLRRAGLKLTPQRIAIVRQIADDRTHPTAQELFDRLRPDFPTMSFATVYNTLDALAGCGLTTSLRLHTRTRTRPRGAVRFDPNVAPHDHAVCDACGAVADVPAADGAHPSRLLDGGFHVRSEEHTYRGLCARCQSQSHALSKGD